MHPYSAVSPITQRLVQVLAIVEKIAGVNAPIRECGIIIIELSSISSQDKNCNIANFILVMLFKIKKINKVCNFERQSFLTTDI